MIPLRHDAYQNPALAAANRAEVLHGLCRQLITPPRRHPARRSASFSRAARLRGSEAPVTAIRAPAVPASPLIGAGKRPAAAPLPPPSTSGARQAGGSVYGRISGAGSFKVRAPNRYLQHHVSAFTGLRVRHGLSLSAGLDRVSLISP